MPDLLARLFVPLATEPIGQQLDLLGIQGVLGRVSGGRIGRHAIVENAVECLSAGFAMIPAIQSAEP